MDIINKITKNTSKNTVQGIPTMRKEKLSTPPKNHTSKISIISPKPPPHKNMNIERLPEKIDINLKKQRKFT